MAVLRATGAKRTLCLAIALVLTLSVAPAASAAERGVTTSTIYGGPMVCVDMDGRIAEVVTANGSVVDDAPVSEMVAGSVAAMNGGFFNAYYTGTARFPDNCPMIYGPITSNGEVINATAGGNVVGFTYDGKALIDRVELKVTADVHGKGIFTIWGVNKQFADDGAIMLMTPELTLPFTIKSDAMLFTIKDGRIVAKFTGGTYTAPANCSVLIFNASAVAGARKWETLPEIGDYVSIMSSYTPTKTQNAENWKNIKTMVTGGRMLVQNGVNVTADEYYNKSFDSDSKQSNNSVASRSYAAVMKDGRVAFGSASASFPKLADALVAAGVMDAVSLDGGASCMVYADGKFLLSAGRELASVLVI